MLCWIRALSAVASIALVIACSSSSSTTTPQALGGTEKLKTCKSPQTPGACQSCDAAKCSSQYAPVIGSDPNSFGGACADYFQCQCGCLVTDTACTGACTKTTDCQNALT